MAGITDTSNMKDEEPRHPAGTKRSGSEVIGAPTFEVCNGMDNHAHVKNPRELILEANHRRRHDNRLLYYNDSGGHCRRCSAVKTRPKRKMRPKRRLTTRR